MPGIPPAPMLGGGMPPAMGGSMQIGDGEAGKSQMGAGMGCGSAKSEKSEGAGMSTQPSSKRSCARRSRRIWDEPKVYVQQLRILSL